MKTTRYRKQSFTTVKVIRASGGEIGTWYIRTSKGVYYKIKMWIGHEFDVDVRGHYVIPKLKRIGGSAADYIHRGFIKVAGKELAQLLLSA